MIKKARELAELGDVDAARRVIAAAPPGPVIIEVQLTVSTRGRRVR